MLQPYKTKVFKVEDPIDQVMINTELIPVGVELCMGRTGFLFDPEGRTALIFPGFEVNLLVEDSSL